MVVQASGCEEQRLVGLVGPVRRRCLLPEGVVPLGPEMAELAHARLNVEETRHFCVKPSPPPSCGVVLQVVEELQEVPLDLCARALHVRDAALRDAIHVVDEVDDKVLVQAHVGCVDHPVDLGCLRDSMV